MTDTSTAAMAQAVVTVTNIATKQTQSALTDATGNYRFNALAIGTYQIQVSTPGFRPFTAENVELLINQERRVDVKMEVGAVQQTVQVNAAAVQVETTSTQLGSVIQEKTLLDLPLNGRSFVDLLSLQAGVAPGASTTNTAGGGEVSRDSVGLPVRG